MRHLKNKILILIIAIVSVVAITINVYAYISRISTRGEIEVSATTVNAETTYTASGNSFNWTYNEAGDVKEINITTNNRTGAVLHRFYNIQLTSGYSSNENLLKAILVYYNDNFVDTLYGITNGNTRIEEEYNFIGVSSNKTDSFKFELHQAAQNSIFDNKDIKVTITTYTENSDYLKYIFVNGEDDFKKAIDDCNSGLFTEIPSIVLCGNLTLQNSYTISEPVKLYLNGSTINGSLTINDTVTTNPNALLEVLGNGTFNATVTLGANYDSAGAVLLVKNHIKEVLKNGLSAGSTTNILGYYSFYGVTVSAINRCTYTSPNVIIANTSNEYYSAFGSVRVNSDENISFKILGSKTELIDATLAHMPANGDTISLDLFLPTYIPSQNASITWTSSDESIITSTGRITAERLENASVTLYAEIKVNNTVITRKYNFKVSAHNNEINFYKLVQEISPIVINTVRNSAADDPDALYHLPIVSENNGVYGTYDYRTSYKCPTNTELFDWIAYKNIGLENITYSMTQEQQTNFDYITLTNSNELYLNNITLNNYASITITGDFGNSETYSTDINISITVGSNTQLLEKAFTQVSEELSQISVLGNILSTRISNGMANERGNFTLSHQFIDSDTNQVNEDYTIEYSGEADIISSITYNSTTQKYEFSINPEYFNEYETTVAFTATVYYRKNQTGETSKSRTFYVTVPAALHAKDFGTISIYNSTKYQVFNQLPANEKSGTTGYTVSGSTLTDNNLDYILLRDIVGDANYLAQYCSNNNAYLTKINYITQNYCTGTETLSYLTASSNPTSTTDTLAYDFARLIEWATGDTRVAASTVVSNTTALGTYASNKANAEDYLNDDEIAVLKQFYRSSTGATEAEWNSLFDEVFNVAPGYIYTNPELINQVIKLLQSTLSSFYNGGTSTSFATIFGKYMEVIQRYAVSTTTVNKDDAAPCQEIYNTRYRWVESDTQLSSYTYQGNSYSINFSIRLVNGKYWNRYNFDGGAAGGDSNTEAANYSLLASDRTSYITENELTILRVFLLNCVSANNGSTTGLNASMNTTSIASILTADAGKYYSGFSASDFNTVAKAILNGFDACMEIPIYFSTDGVSKIIKYFYDDMGYDLPTYDGTTHTTPFKSSLNSNTPYITNADNIKSILSYFVNLKTLAFNGNENLAAFLSENGLSTVFARTGLYNTKIETLTMKHVAHSSINFDLTNIKNFEKLKILDLSNNTGIQNVNELVNVNRENYTYVDISNIGVEYDYQEFAIDNIASSTCTVWYTNSSNQRAYSNTSNASLLSELSDFNKFISKYMYMTNVVYDENGSTTQIVWRIDEGNEIYKNGNNYEITSSGKYPEISSVEDMNKFVSPYYYCNTSFTYLYGNDQSYRFIAGYAYKAYFQGGLLQFTSLGQMSETSIVDNSLRVTTDASNITKTIDTTITSTEDTTGGTRVIQSTTVCYENEVGGSGSATISIAGYKFHTSNNSNYIYYTGSGFDITTASATATIFFFIDNETADLLVNNTLVEDNSTFGESSGANLYMCFIYNNTLYFVGNVNHGTGNNTYYDVTVTTSKNSACTYTYSYSGTSRTRIYDNLGRTMYIVFNSNKLRHYSTAPTNIRRTSNNSSTYTYNGTFRPYFLIYDSNDEVVDGYYAYSLYCRVVKIENLVTTVSQVESVVSDSVTNGEKYYYYIGNTTTFNGVQIKSNTIIKVNDNYVTPVSSRTRTNTRVDTNYIIVLNYKTSADSQVYELDVTNYSTIYWLTTFDGDYESLDLGSLNKPSNTSVTTNGEWSNWSNPIEWQFDKIIANNYASYVTGIDSSTSTKLSLDAKLKVYTEVNSGYNYIYRYTGTTGSENVYKESTTGTNTSYTRNYGYQLKITNNVLTWSQYSTSLNDATGTTMDSILTEANSHFRDYQYGVYYGKYYAYYGNARYISSGIYVRQQYIYRIMPNITNTAFEWVEVGPYTRADADDILISLGTGGLGVGDICYANGDAAFGFFKVGWYKVVLDEKTNIVNLVKFNDVGFTTYGASSYTRLTNDKLVRRTGDYLGYSGTFTIQISAMVRVIENGVVVNEYIKTYKLKFVGSLYE